MPDESELRATVAEYLAADIEGDMRTADKIRRIADQLEAQPDDVPDVCQRLRRLADEVDPSRHVQ